MQLLSSRHRNTGLGDWKYVPRWTATRPPGLGSGGEASNTREKHRDTCKAGAEDWLVHNFEQQLPDSESTDARPTSESGSDDFEHGAVVGRNDQREQ